ncbi:hypothetical protein Tco_1371466 [Tanacetum coccineum]
MDRVSFLKSLENGLQITCNLLSPTRYLQEKSTRWPQLASLKSLHAQEDKSLTQYDLTTSTNPETRSDRDKARHSVSSTSAHHNLGSSSRQGDDDEDDGASRASTPSHTTYLNSLGPLDYQQYDVPTSSEQNDDLLFECQTDLLNQTQQMHKELRVGFKSFAKTL